MQRNGKYTLEATSFASAFESAKVRNGRRRTIRVAGLWNNGKELLSLETKRDKRRVQTFKTFAKNLQNG